jgi:hypothetical protein
MVFLKKYWGKALIALAFILVIVLFLQFISWRTSARYSRFVLANAGDERNSSVCDKYWDFEKVIDNNLRESLGDANDDLNSLAYVMAANMRPMLIAQFEAGVKESYEKDNGKKGNVFVNFWNSFTNKSKYGITKVEKINKNKENYFVCPLEESGCVMTTWEKSDKKWKITRFVTDIPIKKVLE